MAFSKALPASTTCPKLALAAPTRLKYSAFFSDSGQRRSSPRQLSSSPCSNSAEANENLNSQLPGFRATAFLRLAIDSSRRPVFS